MAFTIGKHVSKLQIAPDQVGLYPVFDGPICGVSNTYTNGYDARYNPPIIFLWDTGEDRTFTAPVNLDAGAFQGRYPRGPYVKVVYQSAGTKNITCTAINLETGVTETATTTHVVGDQDTAYPTTQTICVNPNGDSDFTGAPTGAAQVNLGASNELTDDDTIWTSRQGGSKLRWLFKKGGTYTVGIDIDAFDTPDMLFGAYGSGADPILQPFTDGTKANRNFYIKGNHGGLEAGTMYDIRFDGLDARGGLDPTTTGFLDYDGTEGAQFIWCLKPMNMTITNCTLTGWSLQTLYVATGGNDTANRENIVMENCVMTDFGGGEYPTFIGPNTHEDSSLAYVGCRMANNPDALDDPKFRAPCRSENIAWFNSRSTDWFHTDSTQECIKINNTPDVDGNVANIQDNSFEGGLKVLSVNANYAQSFDEGVTRDGGAINNVVIMNNRIVANYRCQNFVRSQGQGVHVRANTMILPGIPYYTNSLDSFVIFLEEGSSPTSETAPNSVCDNRFIDLRTTVQNNSTIPDEVDYSGFSGIGTVTESGNITHAPNRDTPITTYAPLDDDGGALWQARNKGRRDATTKVLDASLATPADSVQTFRPESGSSVYRNPAWPDWTTGLPELAASNTVTVT